MKDEQKRELIQTTITYYSTLLLGWILSALVILEFIQLALRYLFDQGLFWASDVTLLLLLSLGWLGAAHLWIINQHLALTIFDKWLKPYHLIIDGLADLIAILGMLYLLPKFFDVLKIYSKIELSVLPISAAAVYIPPLISIILIGISAVIKLSTAIKQGVAIKAYKK